MIDNFSTRTKMMLGDDGYSRLVGARVAVFGVGGVGGYAVEALARAGVGAIDLVDSDTVSESNINRQIIATRSTVGKYKTEAARERIFDINPDCTVTEHRVFFGEETAEQFDFTKFDYVIDAIDSVKQKVELIARATEAGTKIISAMGAGNKLDPTRFKVADISKTAVCPLAKAVRGQLRRRGINHLKVVFSDEPPCGSLTEGEKREAQSAVALPCGSFTEDKKGEAQSAEALPCGSLTEGKKGEAQSAVETTLSKEHSDYASRRSPGSISFVPSVMGLILAGEVIKEISAVE